MNIDVENKDFEYTYRLGKSQIIVECDIDTEGKGGLGKILTVTGSVCPVKVDTFVGEAKVYGKLVYHVLYLNSDNNLVSSEYASDFVESIGSSDIESGDTLFARLNVQDIDSMAKGNSIRMQAVIDMSLYGVKENKVQVITGTSDVLTKCEDLETSVHIAYVDTSIDVVDEYATGDNVDKILLFEQDATIENVKPNRDSFIVSGTAYVRLLYSSDNKIFARNIDIPYSEEVKCLGVDKTSTVCLMPCVKDSKLIIGGVEGENVLKMSLTIGLAGDVYEYDKVKVVADAYSCDNELELVRDCVSYDKVVDTGAISERISGEASLSEVSEGIKKVIAVVALPNNMANISTHDGDMTADILLNVAVVYISQDDKYNVMNVELPASINVALDCIKSGDRAYADIVIESITARAKHERDIDIQCEIALEYVVIRGEKCTILKDIREGEAKQNTHKAMSIYFAKDGDTPWDVVKALGASEESISASNVDIDMSSLRGGERVMVFREING